MQSPENMNYREFLQTKVELAKDSGFDVDKEKINPALKPHQRDAVIWALKGGEEHYLRALDLERPCRRSNTAIRSSNTKAARR